MRGPELGVKPGKVFWEKPVLGHGEEDPGLAHHHHEHHGAETGEGPQLDERPEPAETFSRTIDGQGNGGGNGQFLKRDDAGEDEGDEDVEDGAEQKGTKNPEGHVALGVFGLLGGC